MNNYHPLEKFTHCPICGSSDFIINNFKSKRCLNCDFVYYMNISAATAAFITNDKQELLVVRRGKEPAKGTLDLPGGFVDCHETAEDGIRREVKEETNLDITDCKYLFSLPNIYPYSGFDVHTLDLFFECKFDESCNLMANDDAAELQWIPVSKLNPADFGLRSISKAVEIFSLKK